MNYAIFGAFTIFDEIFHQFSTLADEHLFISNLAKYMNAIYSYVNRQVDQRRSTQEFRRGRALEL